MAGRASPTGQARELSYFVVFLTTCPPCVVNRLLFPMFLRTPSHSGSASCAGKNRDCGPPGAESAPPVTLCRPVESHTSSSLVQRHAHAAQSALQLHVRHG